MDIPFLSAWLSFLNKNIIESEKISDWKVALRLSNRCTNRYFPSVLRRKRKIFLTTAKFLRKHLYIFKSVQDNPSYSRLCRSKNHPGNESSSTSTCTSPPGSIDRVFDTTKRVTREREALILTRDPIKPGYYNYSFRGSIIIS